jgi:hypothetical protein
MTVSLLTANNITSTIYEWLGHFISPYWWHTQLKHFWTKNHTATILNYLTLTRKIQREWTLVYLTISSVNWVFLAWVGQFKTSFRSRFKGPRVPKKAQFTQEQVEYNVFLVDEPLKGSKSLKIFKISLTFHFDKLWRLSKSAHTGEISQILTVSNKKTISVQYKKRKFPNSNVPGDQKGVWSRQQPEVTPVIPFKSCVNTACQSFP